MANFTIGPRWLGGTTAMLITLTPYLAHAAQASLFSQREVSPSQFVLVAAPIGQTANYQLLILEQLSSRRPCWQESGSQPVNIEPLLLNFDFTGICNRSTDSNGYSLRMAHEDLGLLYNLRIVRRQNDLLLLGVANRNPDAGEVLIGRTQGIPHGFGKIVLEPNWRLTRRVYNGRAIEHLYLTHDQPLNDFLAGKPFTAASQPVVPAPRPLFATRPTPKTVVAPAAAINPTPAGSGQETAPEFTFVQVPTPSRSIEIPVPQPEQAAVGARPNSTLAVPGPDIPLGSGVRGGLPTIVVNPVPGRGSAANGNVPPAAPSNLAGVMGYRYRVLVEVSSERQQNRVRALVPGAFRTRVNGRLMMQAGVFKESEKSKAEAVLDLLTRENFRAMIVPVQ